MARCEKKEESTIVAILGILNEMEFIRFDIEPRYYNCKPVTAIHIPIKHNGIWNDAYREKLNVLCEKLSETGCRWAAEYPGQNALINKGEDGEPWMLFNGGETIDLCEPEEVQALALDLSAFKKSQEAKAI
jgi:hypothetical protein